MEIRLKISKVEKYPAKQHAQRVAAQLGVSDGLIYLLGQYGADKEDSDMPKTWYQRRFFYYMSGVDEPNACLTYNCRTHELVLYIEDIDWDKLIWTGRGSTIEEAKTKYDVDDVRLNSRVLDDVRTWLKHDEKGRFYALHRKQTPQDVENLDQRLDAHSLLPAIDKCRVIKDPHEIQLIKRANEISDLAHRAVLERVATAKNEAELSAVFQDVCISNLATQAYQPIFGSGAKASTLHYTAKNEPLKGRQLICADAGASYQLYASDVTRTFPLNGEWTKEAKEIYDLVEAMQESSIAMCKPGAKIIDLHRHCHGLAIRGLLKLGVLHNGTAEEVYASGVSAAFYPHGLSHHLGLETHDVASQPIYKHGILGSGSSDLPLFARSPDEQPKLEVGMVITIEPGIYFNRQHLEQHFLKNDKYSRYIDADVLKRYFPVGGVRIEDDILISRAGYVNLTTAPKGDEALEIIRQGFLKERHSSRDDWEGSEYRI